MGVIACTRACCKVSFVSSAIVTAVVNPENISTHIRIFWLALLKTSTFIWEPGCWGIFEGSMGVHVGSLEKLTQVSHFFLTSSTALDELGA